MTRFIEQLVNVLHKYEEKSLYFYADQSQSKLILADNTNDLYKQLKEMVSKTHTHTLLTNYYSFNFRERDSETHSITFTTGSVERS